jgi:hypothetical protein
VVSDGTKTQSEGRKARLAAALRENLKRRKAQARAKTPKTLDAAPPAGLGGADKVAPSCPNPAVNKGQ